MLQLSSNPTFHFELLRVLGAARYFGADIAEVLKVAQDIVPGDFESWSTEFLSLAEWALSTIDHNKTNDKATLRDIYFRASSYFRSADFFLHGNPDDARINSLWEKQTECFDKAIANMTIPGVRHTLKGDGFDVPIIVYRASLQDVRLPTLILGNGFDGSQEEMLHVNGFAALERGYNVITYEGPGQCLPRRQQNKGFIAEWEKVVTPVIDYLQTLDFVDAKRVGLLGHSLGGFLCARAACFEHRIAAVMCIDGVFDVFEAFSNITPPDARVHLEQGDEQKFDSVIEGMASHATNLRWAIDQLKWSFMASPYQAFRIVREMSLRGISDQIKCPVLIGDAEDDKFFKGQPLKLQEALGERGTMVAFTRKEAAESHCQVGASVYLNQVVLEWFKQIVEDLE